MVLLSGNRPFRTEVAAVFIFGRIQSDDISGAAAASMVLLFVSLVVLIGIGLFGRRASRHEE